MSPPFIFWLQIDSIIQKFTFYVFFFIVGAQLACIKTYILDILFTVKT